MYQKQYIADSLSTFSDSTLVGNNLIQDSENQTGYSVQEIFNYLGDFLQLTLFNIADTPVTFLSIIVFIIFIVGFTYLALFVKQLLQNTILPRFINDSGLRYTLSRMSQYIIIIIGFFVSVQFLGVDLTGLAVVFGFLSVGIGFGLQNVTSNFISGLIVLFERPISVGD